MFGMGTGESPLWYVRSRFGKSLAIWLNCMEQQDSSTGCRDRPFFPRPAFSLDFPGGPYLTAHLSPGYRELGRTPGAGVSVGFCFVASPAGAAYDRLNSHNEMTKRAATLLRSRICSSLPSSSSASCASNPESSGSRRELQQSDLLKLAGALRAFGVCLGDEVF